MLPLSAGRLLIHLAVSLGAGAFMGLVDAYGMGVLLGADLGWTFWLVIMPLGWIQCLISLFGMTTLLGATRLPGLLVVLAGGLLVSLPLTLEVRVVVGLLDPMVSIAAPMVESLGRSLAVCLVFSGFAWGVMERRPFGIPPCSWTMMGAGGPGAELDMEEAMERLEERLRRKRAESPAPRLPFHPPAPPSPEPEPAAKATTVPPSTPSPAGVPPGVPSEGAPPAASSPEAPPSPSAPPPLRLARMPEGLAGGILCIEMEDHYLRIRTDHGEGMILGRLRDAERELGEAGMKVHRSWWVARSAVRGAEREGRNLTLRLSNGMAVPVSRANQPKVGEAGWLED